MVPKYSPRGAKAIVPTRKTLEYDLTRFMPLRTITEGSFVRYSISKAMSKVVVFQGRARPSHLCYTFRITSLLCLESSSTNRVPASPRPFPAWAEPWEGVKKREAAKPPFFFPPPTAQPGRLWGASPWSPVTLACGFSTFLKPIRLPR